VQAGWTFWKMLEPLQTVVVDKDIRLSSFFKAGDLLKFTASQFGNLVAGPSCGEKDCWP
jgi:hypothetical protein